MAFEEETKQLLEFHKSLDDDQLVQFMGVLTNSLLYGGPFLEAGIRTLLAHELKIPPKEKD